MKNKRINLVKKLQYLLSKSYYAKLIAVKRITTNKGKNTPGIDGVKRTSPSAKYKGAMSLTNKSYKSKPLKRVYIKKSSGKKKRPLGIPTFKDRAMQALYQLSLDPIAECILDHQSFGFRKYRSTKDACEYLFKCLSTKHSGKWVLEGDIKGCFDNISHKWIQDNIIMDKRILKEFLKSGYVINKEICTTDKGTPQGGIISPTLANLVLNGMAEKLADRITTG